MRAASFNATLLMLDPRRHREWRSLRLDERACVMRYGLAAHPPALLKSRAREIRLDNTNAANDASSIQCDASVTRILNVCLNSQGERSRQG